MRKVCKTIYMCCQFMCIQKHTHLMSNKNVRREQKPIARRTVCVNGSKSITLYGKTINKYFVYSFASCQSLCKTFCCSLRYFGFHATLLARFLHLLLRVCEVVKKHSMGINSNKFISAISLSSFIIRTSKKRAR